MAVRFYSFIFFLYYMWMMTACSEVGFSPSKAAVLTGKSGFSATADNPDDASGEVIAGGGSTYQVDIAVERVCSNKRTREQGNVLGASKVILKIVDSDGRSACPADGKDYKSALINQELLRVGIGCTLADGDYELEFYSAESPTGQPLADFSIDIKRGKLKAEDSKMEVTYSTNPKENGVVYNEEIHAACENYASPLVVKLKDEGIQLSAPLAGVDFDILGDGQARRISWSSSDAFAFIALPNAQGDVLSVHQLFGDNTRGPDGQLANNGYTALAKHDSNRDGVIDSRDAVYADLRLWIDRNYNGRSDPGELERLEARQISSIDLEFDANYAERDQYGNKILYKSIASLSSGDALLVFDIWFRLID